MKNCKIIDNINQLFHNAGTKQENRLNVLIDSLVDKEVKEENKNFIEQNIQHLLSKLDFQNKELMQELFMKLGSKYTKCKLDQYYTPLTISHFISSLMMVVSDATTETKKVIDPAGGTGDLLIYFKGHKTIWDIDPQVLKLCKLNYQLHQHQQTNLCLHQKNSLMDFKNDINKYDYVVINPPFGSNTVITDTNILNSFVLGKEKPKQEIGVLFLELGLQLLKDKGVLFAIIPSGYLGNTNAMYTELRKYLLSFKILGVIELPKHTFKRSNTGVNVSLCIIQKTPHFKETPPFEIFISGVENIGYDLYKKNTPIKYKYNKETGDMLLDDVQHTPIQDNDFFHLSTQFKWFCKKNNVENIMTDPDPDPNDPNDPTPPDYECVMSNALDSTILDVKRYKQTYIQTLNKIKLNGSFDKIIQFGKIIKKACKIEKTQKYKYIDIGEISSPLYDYKEMYGWELPIRAKYLVKKYDILVSKLEGNFSYCVILEESQNIIATNGVFVIRPNDLNCLHVLFANIVKKDFAVIHRCLVTGSIMASLHDKDIENILIDKNVEIKEISGIIQTLEKLITFKHVNS